MLCCTKQNFAIIVLSIFIVLILLFFYKIRQRYQIREEAVQQETKKFTEKTIGYLNHEIRNLLNTSSGIVDEIEEYLVKTTTTQGNHAEIMDHIDILKNMFEFMDIVSNDSMDIRMLEGGKVTLKPVTVNMNSFFKYIKKIAAIQIKNNDKITLVIPEMDSKLNFVFDRHRVETVLLNLVFNAIKFTDEGVITVAFNTSRNMLNFTVSDTGDGVSVSIRHKLFITPFLQNRLRDVSKCGPGFGLYLCNLTVKSMSGDIGLTKRSEGEQGAEFWFTIPLKKPTPNSTPKTKLSRSLVGNTILRVLIVDDVALNRKFLILKLLKINNGFLIVEGIDGEDALQLWKNQGPFDLVFMDVVMPVMDGLTATRELCKNYLGVHDFIVIIVSGNCEPTDDAAAMDSGASYVLHKPVDGKTLTDILKKCKKLQKITEERSPQNAQR